MFKVFKKRGRPSKKDKICIKLIEEILKSKSSEIEDLVIEMTVFYTLYGFSPQLITEGDKIRVETIEEALKRLNF